ncbi:MAG: ATP synthase F0 subunit B [Terriglobales bacterium]
MTARIAAVLLLLLLPFSVCLAQEHAAPASQTEAQPEAQPQKAQPASADEHAAKQPAAGGHGEEGGDPHAEFKYSASVRWLAKTTGMEVTTAYWVSVIFNFLVMAIILWVLLKSRMVSFFRDRTDSIQNAMEEARRASEDANARLAQIEGRLSRLDSEVAELRNTAEADAVAEDKRLQEAAREDATRIVRTAEQEIDAAARLARRELRAYAAELAVSLAEKRIQVTPATDQELVRSFTDRLDRDGGRS